MGGGHATAQSFARPPDETRSLDSGGETPVSADRQNQKRIRVDGKFASAKNKKAHSNNNGLPLE